MKVKKILIAAACLVVIAAAAFLITRKSDADRVAELLERADQFEEQGDYDSAIIILRNALKLMPSYGAIHVRLAYDYAQTDQSHDSIKHYDAALRVGVENEGFLRDYAQACAQYNAVEQLAKPAAKLLKLIPNDADAHFWMARSLAADRPQEAISYAEKGLRECPHETVPAMVYLLLAELYTRRDNFEKAEEWLWVGLLQLPDDAELTAALASIEVEFKKDAEALQHIEAALAAVENADSAARISVYTVAADVFRRLANHERGIEICRRLVKLAPDDTKFQKTLARRYMAGNKMEDAITLLQESLQKNPDDELRILLAEALLRSQKTEEAQACLKELSSRLASSPRALYLKGAVLLTLGDLWKAEPLLRRARDAAPGLVPAQAALGICYWRMDMLQSAEVEFEAVLRKAPADHETALRLARCKQAQGDPTAAEALAAGVIAADETNKQALEILIACKAQSGKPDEVERLLQAEDRASASPQDLLTVARALAGRGRTDEAMAALAAALEKKPDFPEAIALKARILEFMGSADQAEELLRTLAATRPKSVAWALEYSMFLHRNGKKDKARESLAELTRRLPQSAPAHRAVGRYYHETGNLEEAAASLKVATELEPKEISARRRLVHVLIGRKHFDQARTEVKTMKEDFGESLDVLALEGMLMMAEEHPDEALACFRSLAAQWPKQPEGQILIGTALAHKGNFAGAVEAFEAARDLAPRDVRVRTRLRDAYLAAGLYNKATEEAKQVIKLRPGGAEDLHRFAMSLAGTQQTDKAREILERLSADTPDKAEYHVQLAMLLAAEGETQRAEDEIRKALDIDRAPRTVWAACAFYWDQGNRSAARKLIEDLARERPRFYHSLLARHHAIAGQVAEAEAELKEIIRLVPDNAMAVCGLADYYASLPDRFDDAMRTYRKALDADADSTYARRRMAVLLAGAGRLDEAEDILEPLAAKHPHDVYVHARLAEVAVQRMRLINNRDAATAAVERCTKLAEKFPHIARAHYLAALAQFLAEPGDRQGPADALARALEIAPDFAQARLLRAQIHADAKQFAQAEKECRNLLETDPDHVEGMLLLGDLLARRKAEDDEYEKLPDEFPNNPAAKLIMGIAIHSKDPDRSERAIEEGLGKSPSLDLLKVYCDFLATDGRANEALAKMQAFADKNAQSMSARRALAQAHAAAGDMAAAAREQRRAYALSGRSSDDLRRTIAMLVNAQAEAEAVSLIKEHIANAPHDSGARLLLARVLGKFGKVDAAIAEITGILEDDPNNTEAHLTLGTAYLLKKRYDDAAEHYEAVLMREPSNYTAANNLAYILAEHLGRSEEAERIILPALERFPDSALIQDTYGWILYKIERFDEAREALQQSLKLEPDQPIVMFHLAVVCKQLEDATRARKLLRRTLELDPTFEKADDARTLLESLGPG